MGLWHANGRMVRVLAAKDILGQSDYEQDVRKHLMPYVRTSVANRWLMNRVGDRTFKRMCKAWMKDQKKRDDGLIWIGNYSVLRFQAPPVSSGESVHAGQRPKSPRQRCSTPPFRPALKRDVWTPSSAAQAWETSGTPFVGVAVMFLLPMTKKATAQRKKTQRFLLNANPCGSRHERPLRIET